MKYKQSTNTLHLSEGTTVGELRAMLAHVPDSATLGEPEVGTGVVFRMEFPKAGTYRFET